LYQAWIFHDGTIEVDVIGVAFRIDTESDNYSCEGFYIRPANGWSEDQVRRNHSTQYFSYPGYDFDRLRREAPERYESYADLAPGDWTHLRIEASGSIARFYVGAAEQPVLVVRDLRHGRDRRGTVGSSSHYDCGDNGTPRLVIATSDSDAAIPMVGRKFQEIAASLSLLAMTGTGCRRSTRHNENC
jgi:hypothetical protein